jgi:hypothetical protein
MNETTIEYWQQKAADYKWLFEEQQRLTCSYREICDRQKQELVPLKYRVADMEQMIFLLTKQLNDIDTKHSGN